MLKFKGQEEIKQQMQCLVRVVTITRDTGSARPHLLAGDAWMSVRENSQSTCLKLQ